MKKIISFTLAILMIAAACILPSSAATNVTRWLDVAPSSGDSSSYIWTKPNSGSGSVSTTIPKNYILKTTSDEVNSSGNLWHKVSAAYNTSGSYVSKYVGLWIYSGNTKTHSNHVYSYAVTKSPTCMSTGTKTGTCVCGAKKSLTLSKVSHSYDSSTYMCVYGCGSWYPTLKSSTAVSGTRYIVADGKQSKTGPYTDCKVVTTYKKAASVTVTAKVVNQKGSTWYKLSDGSYIFEDNITDHSSHTWNSGTVTKKATCTSTGTKKYTCTFCGATKTTTLNKLSHSYDKSTHRCVNGCGSYDPKSVTSVTVQKGTYYVTSDGVITRAWPYKVCAKVNTLNKGTAVSVTAAVKNNEKNIWYKLSDGSYIFSENVALPSVKLNAASETCYNGLTATLKATTFPSGKTVTWKSSDTSVATISSSGVITGKKAGKCTVTASFSSGGKSVSASCKVTVKNLTYTIKFFTNCGSNYSAGSDFTTSKKCTYTESWALPSNPYIRTGYTFLGWATSSSGSVRYAPGEKVRGLSKKYGDTVNLYAVWQANTVKVYFNANSGTVSDKDYNSQYFYNRLTSDNFIIHTTSASSSAKYCQTFTYNTAMRLEDYTAMGLKRTGYTFNGWNTKADGSGTKFTASAQYTPVNLNSGVKTGNKTVKLYAQWTPITYYIAYNGNGATSGSMSKSAAIKYGKSVTLAANKFKLTNYSFLGWSKTKTGNVEYKNSASVKNVSSKSGTVTLYAVWGYKVSYNSNGGSGTVNNQTVKKGGSVSASACSFTRQGYTFECWNTKANGTGTDITVGSDISKLKPSSGKVTLYAKWAKFVPRKKAPVMGSDAYPSSGNGYKSYGNGNCTWYAFYRAQEILGECPTALTPSALGSGDAFSWWNAHDKFAGYSTDYTKPKPGAIIVWGGTVPGHVAIVEEVGSDYIVLTESSYGGVWYYNNAPKFNDPIVYNYYGKQNSSYWGSVKCKISNIQNYAQYGEGDYIGFTGYIYLV